MCSLAVPWLHNAIRESRMANLSRLRQLEVLVRDESWTSKPLAASRRKRIWDLWREVSSSPCAAALAVHVAVCVRDPLTYYVQDYSTISGVWEQPGLRYTV